MKVTVETINGKPCTVIRKPFDAEFVISQLNLGIPVLVEATNSKRTVMVRKDRTVILADHLCKEAKHMGLVSTVTILPPLKHGDAHAVSLYKANGIYPLMNVGGSGDIEEPVDIRGQLFVSDGWSHRLVDITDSYSHACCKGQRVEIAIAEAANA